MHHAARVLLTCFNLLVFHCRIRHPPESPKHPHLRRTWRTRTAPRGLFGAKNRFFLFRRRRRRRRRRRPASCNPSYSPHRTTTSPTGCFGLCCGCWSWFSALEQGCVDGGGANRRTDRVAGAPRLTRPAAVGMRRAAGAAASASSAAALAHRAVAVAGARWAAESARAGRCAASLATNHPLRAAAGAPRAPRTAPKGSGDAVDAPQHGLVARRLF